MIPSTQVHFRLSCCPCTLLWSWQLHISAVVSLRLGIHSRFPHCQSSNHNGYSKIGRCRTTIKHNKVRTEHFYWQRLTNAASSLPRGYEITWWRHHMKTFPRYWPFVRGIHRSAVNFPHKAQWPVVTRSIDVFFDLRLNKRLSKQWRGWWFETPSPSLWRHCTDSTQSNVIW